MNVEVVGGALEGSLGGGLISPGRAFRIQGLSRK